MTSSEMLVLLGREVFTVFLLVVLPFYLARCLYRRVRTPTETVRVTLLDGATQVPLRQTSGAAGYDIFAHTSCGPYIHIEPWSRTIVPTGVCMAIPSHLYGHIASRSSKASAGIEKGGGTIDSDYRGEVKVILQNLTSEGIDVPTEKPIAQIIFERIAIPDIVLVPSLDGTSRGSGGFGSTDTGSARRIAHRK